MTLSFGKKLMINTYKCINEISKLGTSCLLFHRVTDNKAQHP